MRNGEQLGPLSPESVQAQIESGNFSTADYAWTAGLEDWKPLSDVLSGQNHVLATSAVHTSKPKVRTPPRSKLVISFVAAFVLFGLIITLGLLGRGSRSPTRAGLSRFDPDAYLASKAASPAFPYDALLADVQQQPKAKSTSRSAAKPERLDLIALSKKTRSAVVLIEVFDASSTPIATGSGFFVSSDGMLVTNFHVIENAHMVIARAESGTIYRVSGAISANKESDIALLKAAAKEVPVLILGDSEEAEAGEPVAVIGSPLGLEGSLSEGIISAKRQLPSGEEWLQITAPISPGSSGSPVMNSRAEVIGVATMLIRNGQALNFAIPSKAVRALVKKSEGQGTLLPFASIKEEHDRSERHTEYAQAGAAAKARVEALQSPEMKAASDAQQGALRTKDWREALKAAQLLVTKYPNLPFGYELLGAAYQNMGFSEDAILAYQHAVKLDSSKANAWLSLGSLFNEERKTSQAISAFSQAAAEYQQELKYATDDNAKAEGLIGLGKCYVGLGNRDSARTAYQEVTGLSSAFRFFKFSAWDALGELDAEDGDERNAVAAFYNSLQYSDALEKKLQSDAWKRLAVYYEEKGLTEKVSRAMKISWELHLNGR